MMTVEQFTALKARRLDVGFGPLQCDDDDIVSKLVRDEPMVAALPVNHRMARHNSLSLAKLAPEPLLLYPAKPRPSYADQVLEVFHSRGLEPTIALETNEVQTAIGLVVAGLGYTLVPRSLQDLDRTGVQDLPLSLPILLNRRTDDDSELTTFLRGVVGSLPLAISGSAKGGANEQPHRRAGA